LPEEDDDEPEDGRGVFELGLGLGAGLTAGCDSPLLRVCPDPCFARVEPEDLGFDFGDPTAGDDFVAFELLPFTERRSR
jgi:hypothetical protein